MIPVQVTVKHRKVRRFRLRRGLFLSQQPLPKLSHPRPGIEHDPARSTLHFDARGIAADLRAVSAPGVAIEPRTPQNVTLNMVESLLRVVFDLGFARDVPCADSMRNRSHF